MSGKEYSVDISSGILLSKEQIRKLLDEITPGLLTSPVRYNPETRPYVQFKKLGVLVDIDDIAKAKDTNVAKNKQTGENNNPKAFQSLSFNCTQCRRILPTAHLLDLHITEQHDMYFAAGVERGDRPLYCCYIQECPIKFHSPSERKDHCITVHKFPANYRFDPDKTHGVKDSKQTAKNSMDVDDTDEKPPNGAQIPVIKAFTFGHTTQRTFNAHEERNDGKTLLDVKAMKDAIEEME